MAYAKMDLLDKEGIDSIHRHTLTNPFLPGRPQRNRLRVSRGRLARAKYACLSGRKTDGLAQRKSVPVCVSRANAVSGRPLKIIKSTIVSISCKSGRRKNRIGFIRSLSSTVSCFERLLAFLVPRMSIAECFVTPTDTALIRARLFDEQGCYQGSGIGRINAFAQELTPVDRIFSFVAGLTCVLFWCHRWVLNLVITAMWGSMRRDE